MLDESRNIWDWLSPEWFYPNTLATFEWLNIGYLYLILAIPLVVTLRWAFNLRLKQKIEIAVSQKSIASQTSALLRHLPQFFFLFAIFLLIITLARPQRANTEVEQTAEGIDILLVLDISESMLIEDFRPNRLESAKLLANDFILGRQYDRIGLVVFSGSAYTHSPLTTDYQILQKLVREINQGMISQGGTAIGEAIGISINRLKESSSKTKIIILISDGDNTAGSLDPITTAKLAASYGIKIYTIVVGREGEVPLPSIDGRKKKFIDNTVDETSLREIAKIGEGQFFRAINNESLSKVFSVIDSFEKTEVKTKKYRYTEDFYHIYLTWAIIFLLIWLLLKSSFMSNILED